MTAPTHSTKALMFQGTGSDVGKSLLVAGLARAYRRRGLRVAPFKPQNMSNNAAVTADGGEIGRAQALQARAAGLEPHSDMNPVLLKPQSLMGSQIVVQGKVWKTAAARDYQGLKPQLMPRVLESFERLKRQADLVLVEGAGSAAEVNLRAGDIANMGFALASQTPVVLIGDIDRGGVIASLVGTHALLPPEERALLAGYLINKFRGDARLFDTGLQIISDATGLKAWGLVPYFSGAAKLPAEDAVALDTAQDTAQDKAQARAADKPLIVVVKLPHIANFDDFDPLAQDPSLTLRFVPLSEPLPLEAALVILPGSKTTIADLEALRAAGWEADLRAYLRRGGRVLGICGGYQMLGRRLHDRAGLEGAAGSCDGLCLLDLETELTPEKRLVRTQGCHLASGQAVAGYEIHIGRSSGPDCARPLLQLESGPDGASDASGQVMGCYLHGLFGADGFRAAFLQSLGLSASAFNYESEVEAGLDALADHLEAHLDLDGLLAAAR
jgi:adenosylcobyric acid synthase